MQEAEDGRFKAIEELDGAEELLSETAKEEIKQAILKAIDTLCAAAEANKEIYFDPDN